MKRFEDKAVVVSGAAGGQGRAMAEAFAEEGAVLVLVDVTDKISTVATEIATSFMSEVRSVVGDVGEEATWRTVKEALGEYPDKTTVLVNNAGIYKRCAVEELSLEDVDLLYRTNQRAILASVQILHDELLRNKGGRVVNISSTAGITGDPIITAYSGTKWAVRGLTRSLAAELGPKGIRVNAVVPGLFDTAMAAANGNEVNNAILARTFLGRIGQPDEITPAVLLVASDEASYMTGAELVVDGGLSV